MILTPILKFALFAHIILGVGALVASYAVLMSLLKRESKITFLESVSLSGLVLIILSWVSGGYYYLNYYGSAVRDTIKGGPYPWAHLVSMEAKEHIFLFLPFAVATVFISIVANSLSLNQNETIKKSLIGAMAVITVLITAIALSGMMVSGAV